MIVCPHCEHVNLEGIMICQSCQTPLFSKSIPETSETQQTLLQGQTAQLIHQQSQQTIALPLQFTRFRLGKANPHVSPDLDVSGFANAQIVSRGHAEIQQEGQTYYVEDIGSSNGTYLNHALVPRGQRQRLQSGDRIALGKGELVTFIFQMIFKSDL